MRGHESLIGEGLIEAAQEIDGELSKLALAQLQLVMVRTQRLRRGPRGGGLTHPSDVVADSERLDGRRAFLTSEARDQRGIETAAQKDPERNIGNQAPADRPAQGMLQLVEQFLLAYEWHRSGAWRRPVALNSGARVSPAPAQEVRRRKLLHVPEERSWPRLVAEGEVGVEL